MSPTSNSLELSIKESERKEAQERTKSEEVNPTAYTDNPQLAADIEMASKRLQNQDLVIQVAHFELSS